jgi:hypothetical protein
MFKYIDKPQIPDYIVDIIREQYKDHTDTKTLSDFDKMKINDSIQNEIDKAYGESSEGLGMPFEYSNTYEGLASFTMIKADDRITQWVRDNVTDELNGVHVQIIDGKYVFPHIDMLRNRAWNYTIDTGDANTCFYDVRPEYSHLKLSPRTYVPYDRVIETHRYKIENHRWHELAVDKIHSVEDIKDVRLALSISFVDSTQ